MVDNGLVLPAQAHGRERPVLGCVGPHRDDGLAGAPQRVVVAEAVVELAGGGAHHRDVAVGGEPGGADLLDGVVLDPGEPCAIVVAEDAGPVRRGGKRRGRGDGVSGASLSSQTAPAMVVSAVLSATTMMRCAAGSQATCGSEQPATARSTGPAAIERSGRSRTSRQVPVFEESHTAARPSSSAIIVG